MPIFRNGRIEEVYWTYGYSPVFDEDGRVGGTLVVCTETTQQVVAHQHIERAKQEAERARAELHGIFMQAPVPMCILTGPEHVFTLANAPYVKLVGREVVGKPLREVFNPEELAYYAPILDRVYQQGETVRVRETPLQLRGPDGVMQEQFIDFTYYPYCDEHGAPLGVLAVIQDVSMPVHARRQQEALNQQLQQAVHTRDEFLSIASHELRTPLTSLKLQLQTARAQLARDGARGCSARARGAKLVEPERARLSRLTPAGGGHAGRLAHPDGQLQLHRETLDLATWCATSLERFEAQLARRAARCALELPAAPALGRWDRLRLEQVVTNLLTNALRYGAGTPVRVTLARRRARHALLRARTAGPASRPRTRRASSSASSALVSAQPRERPGAGALHRAPDRRGARGQRGPAQRARTGHPLHGAAAAGLSAPERDRSVTG